MTTTYTPSSEDHRLYEFCVLYPYPLPQKEEQQLGKDIDELFAEANGKVIFKDVWGRRGLAYPIKGNTEGSFIVYYVELLPEKLKELDRNLRILKGVLRHLVVKPPEGYKIESFAEKYVQWQQEKLTEGDRAARAKEEELQQQVIERAKRQAKRATQKKAEEAKPVAAGDVTKEIDKMISDADLSL
jgi:small subunit ribosomal protein S6